MKLADWARENMIDYKTAYRWFRAGVLPVPSVQIAKTGTILVMPSPPPPDSVAIYARVSSHDQKADLDRQVARLSSHAAKEGRKVVAIVVEVGSGMNGHRKRLLSVLRDLKVGEILVEHRDRLARFGSEYIEAAMAASGRKLTVLDTTELKDDLVQDMVEVLTSFCARLYGKRSARNRARRAMEATRSC